MSFRRIKSSGDAGVVCGSLTNNYHEIMTTISDSERIENLRWLSNPAFQLTHDEPRQRAEILKRNHVPEHGNSYGKQNGCSSPPNSAVGEMEHCSSFGYVGMPGVGMSVLASIIVDNLTNKVQTDVQRDHAPRFAHLYFKYDQHHIGDVTRRRTVQPMSIVIRDRESIPIVCDATSGVREMAWASQTRNKIFFAVVQHFPYYQRLRQAVGIHVRRFDRELALYVHCVVTKEIIFNLLKSGIVNRLGTVDVNGFRGQVSFVRQAHDRCVDRLCPGWINTSCVNDGRLDAFQVPVRSIQPAVRVSSLSQQEILEQKNLSVSKQVLCTILRAVRAQKGRGEHILDFRPAQLR